MNVKLVFLFLCLGVHFTHSLNLMSLVSLHLHFLTDFPKINVQQELEPEVFETLPLDEAVMETKFLDQEDETQEALSEFITPEEC